VERPYDGDVAVRRGERVLVVQVAGDDKRRVGVGALAVRVVDGLQGPREGFHLSERGLRSAMGVGEPEVLLERVMPVRVLVGESEVGVVPRDPPGGPGEQRAVQHVPVVGGRVGVGGEVGADAELFHDDRLAERAGQFAGDGGGVTLADGVIADGVGMRAEEVGHFRYFGQAEAVVVAGDLDAPGTVAERERLVPAGRPDRVPDDPRPGRDDLVAGVRAAVNGHFVRDQPARDGGVRMEAADHLGGEPGLPAHHPDVVVQVAAVPPGRVPVLAGHMADDKGRNGGETVLGMPVEEVGEACGHRLVDLVRTRHEVGPVEERPGHSQAMPREHGQFRVDDRRVVAAPHQRAAGPRPEVRAEPVRGRAARHDP
jgi:hypothetical protein